VVDYVARVEEVRNTFCRKTCRGGGHVGDLLICGRTIPK
jgi:hypothetical protein